MPVKIRLQRHGRRKQPYYFIVIADSRAPRDGKFIDRIGAYNPNTNPATIELDNQKALEWLENGAVPTDTARAILSYKGVMYRKHLQRGVRKGAFSQEEADKKMAEWLEQKAAKIESKVNKLQSEADTATKTRLEREAKVAQKRADELQAKRAADQPEAAEEATEAEGAAEAGDQPEA